MDCDLVDELLHLQNDDSITPIHVSTNKLLGLDSEVGSKYAKLSMVAEQALLPFPIGRSPTWLNVLSVQSLTSLPKRIGISVQ